MTTEFAKKKKNSLSSLVYLTCLFSVLITRAAVSAGDSRTDERYYGDLVDSWVNWSLSESISGEATRELLLSEAVKEFETFKVDKELHLRHFVEIVGEIRALDIGMALYLPFDWYAFRAVDALAHHAIRSGMRSAQIVKFLQVLRKLKSKSGDSDTEFDFPSLLDPNVLICSAYRTVFPVFQVTPKSTTSAASPSNSSPNSSPNSSMVEPGQAVLLDPKIDPKKLNRYLWILRVAGGVLSAEAGFFLGEAAPVGVEVPNFDSGVALGGSICAALLITYCTNCTENWLKR